MKLDSLPMEQLEKIAELSDPFEESWRAGRRPRIEDVLSRVGDLEQSLALGLLLSQEWEIRVGLGESPTIQEYRERFPGRDDTIFDAIHDLILARDGPVRAGNDATMSQSSGCEDSAYHLGMTSTAGRFRILNHHAQGGLGEIFVAHDGELDRDVAVKQIRLESSDDPESRLRFVREAMVTGRLEHPGIVPVYGLGRDADGRPFYAMRYVKGHTFADVIRRFHEGAKAGGKPAWRGVEIRKLLARLLDVCNVLDYAHSRGVLHRDLKPSNIMVGPFGEVLVLDWGLAKELNRAGIGGDSEPCQRVGSPEPQGVATLPGSAVGTPRFMSPEQASGQPDRVGPASDVYNLGATLYCLLTGRLPFPDDGLEVTLDKVRRGDFPAPRAIDQTIPRPLEAICSRAMALEPGGRYGSPRELAEDLERWLADEPISAWRDHWTTKLRRGVARHRTMVTTGAALILLTFVGLIAIAVLQERSRSHLATVNRDLQEANRGTERSRNRAEDRLELALRAIEHFHRSVSKNLDVKNRPELSPLRQDLLQAPLEFYGLLKKDLQADEGGRPETSAKYVEAVVGFAQITALIGSEPDAIAAYQHAIEVLDQLDRQQPAVDQHRFAHARAYRNLSMLQRALTRVAESLASGERARSLYRTLIAGHPSDERYQFGLAEIENTLALIHRDARHPAEALTNYTQALERLQALVRDHPAATEYQAQLAQVLSNLGVLRRATGLIPDAKQSYEQAIATFRGLVRNQPGIVNHRSALGRTLYNLGNLHGLNLGKGKEAMDYFEQAREVQQLLVQENPTVGEYRADLALTCGQIAAFQRFFRPTESLVNFEHARDLLQGLVRDHPRVTRYRKDLAFTQLQIGGRQIDLGRSTQAMVSLERARELYELLIREAPNNFERQGLLGATFHDRGRALAALGRFQEAADADLQAISRARKAVDLAPANSPARRDLAMDLVRDHEGLAEALRTLNRPTEALRSLCAACDVLEEHHDLNPGEIEKLAQLYSKAINLVDPGGRKPSPDEQVKRRLYAERAIAFLHRSITAGQTNLKKLRNDRSFDPLRGQADFQLLMMDLAFPPDPFTS